MPPLGIKQTIDLETYTLSCNLLDWATEHKQGYLSRMDHPLYQKIADQIEKHIRDGLFTIGEKIPSVRKTSTQMDVSMATVLQAYHLLEDRGIIKAQPQKGYFVTYQLECGTIPATQPPHSPSQLLLTTQQLPQDDSMVQFGCATPHSQYLPIRQLQRSVGRVMRLEPDICAAYAFPSGADALRRQIAIRMLDTGCQISPDDILVTLGCQNALILSLQAITTEGDCIAIESPAYQGVLQAANTLKLSVVEIPCDLETGLNIAELDNACHRQNIKACIVSPENQNPTGSCMPLAAREQLLDFAHKHDFTVIEDDVYGELYYQASRRPALKAMDTNQRVIYCSSFSKTIAPGFRIGWIIGGQYQAAIEELCHMQAFATPSLTQIATANFLENGAYDHHLRKTRQIYCQHLSIFKAAIDAYFPAGTYTSSPQGGFLIWVILPSHINALDLYHAALTEHINILPGIAFSATAKHRHHIRMNFAQPWNHNTESALKTLGQLCHQILD